MIPIRDDNPTRITPWVTWGLVAAIAGVFAAQLALGYEGQRLVADFGAVPVLLLGVWLVFSQPIPTEATHFGIHQDQFGAIGTLGSQFFHLQNLLEHSTD